MKRYEQMKQMKLWSRGVRNGRRMRLLSALLVVIALTGAACGGNDEPQGDRKLVIVPAGGSVTTNTNAAFLVPFSAETGTEIEIVEAGQQSGALEAQVSSGNVLWDIVDCLTADVVARPELYEELDTSVVQSTSDYVFEDSEELARRSIITEYAALPNLAYRTDTYPDQAPASWADFFDTTSFPGARGMFDLGLFSAWRIAAVALIADGVEPDPESLLPLDLDRAYEVLDRIRPDVRAFFYGFTQGQDLLRSGEVDMIMLADGRTTQLIQQGVPVANVYPTDKTFLSPARFCVPKGAPNKEVAFEFMEYMLSNPEQQAVMASLSSYGPPTNAGAQAALDLGIGDFNTLHPELFMVDTHFLSYVQENADELLERWNAWVAS